MDEPTTSPEQTSEGFNWAGLCFLLALLGAIGVPLLFTLGDDEVSQDQLEIAWEENAAPIRAGLSPGMTRVEIDRFVETEGVLTGGEVSSAGTTDYVAWNLPTGVYVKGTFVDGV